MEPRVPSWTETSLPAAALVCQRGVVGTYLLAREPRVVALDERSVPLLSRSLAIRLCLLQIIRVRLAALEETHPPPSRVNRQRRASAEHSYSRCASTPTTQHPEPPHALHRTPTQLQQRQTALHDATGSIACEPLGCRA